MEVMSKKDYEIGDLKLWMEKNGFPPVKVVLRDSRIDRRMMRSLSLYSIHYVAASEDLQAGDVAFSVPNSLVVTLERVLGSESIVGRAEGIKREYNEQAEVIGRAEGIKREYNELDTVWFMAGSLFQQYPYDIPTEAFPFEIFKQAFVAVQSCVIHLQVSNQEAFDIVVQACAADKKFGSPNRMRKAFSDQYGTICTSPSPKIKRVSLLKPQDLVHQEGIEDEFARE